MKIFIFSFFIILLLCCGDGKNCNNPEYYWRPYYGRSLPRDFYRGADSCKMRRYIAMAAVNNNIGAWIVPYQIEDNIIFTEDGKEIVRNATTFIHILCVKNQESIKLIWVDNSVEEIKDRCCLVEGGVGNFDKNSNSLQPIYVAVKKIIINSDRTRAPYVGRTYDYKAWPGMYFTHDGVSSHATYGFYLLAYNCDK